MAEYGSAPSVSRERTMEEVLALVLGYNRKIVLARGAELAKRGGESVDDQLLGGETRIFLRRLHLGLNKNTMDGMTVYYKVLEEEKKETASAAEMEKIANRIPKRSKSILRLALEGNEKSSNAVKKNTNHFRKEKNNQETFKAMMDHVREKFSSQSDQVQMWQSCAQVASIPDKSVDANEQFPLETPVALDSKNVPYIPDGISVNKGSKTNAATPLERYAVDLIYKDFIEKNRRRNLCTAFQSALKRPENEACAKSARTYCLNNIHTAEFLQAAYDNTVDDGHKTDQLKKLFVSSIDSVDLKIRATLNEVLFLGADPVLALARGCIKHVYDGRVMADNNCRMPLDMYLKLAAACEKGLLFHEWRMPGRRCANIVADDTAEWSKKYAQHLAKLGLQTWGKLKDGQVVYPYIFLNDTTDGSGALYHSLCHYDGKKLVGMVKKEFSKTPCIPRLPPPPPRDVSTVFTPEEYYITISDSEEEDGEEEEEEEEERARAEEEEEADRARQREAEKDKQRRLEEEEEAKRRHEEEFRQEEDTVMDRRLEEEEEAIEENLRRQEENLRLQEEKVRHQEEKVRQQEEKLRHQKEEARRQQEEEEKRRKEVDEAVSNILDSYDPPPLSLFFNDPVQIPEQEQQLPLLLPEEESGGGGLRPFHPPYNFGTPPYDPLLPFISPLSLDDEEKTGDEAAEPSAKKRKKSSDEDGEEEQPKKKKNKKKKNKKKKKEKKEKKNRESPPPAAAAAASSEGGEKKRQEQPLHPAAVASTSAAEVNSAADRHSSSGSRHHHPSSSSSSRYHRYHHDERRHDRRSSSSKSRADDGRDRRSDRPHDRRLPSPHSHRGSRYDDEDITSRKRTHPVLVTGSRRPAEERSRDDRVSLFSTP